MQARTQSRLTAWFQDESLASGRSIVLGVLVLQQTRPLIVATSIELVAQQE
jgi:hypothetical protein